MTSPTDFFPHLYHGCHLYHRIPSAHDSMRGPEWVVTGSPSNRFGKKPDLVHAFPSTSNGTPALDGHHDATTKPTRYVTKMDMDQIVRLQRLEAANVHGVEAMG